MDLQKTESRRAVFGWVSLGLGIAAWTIIQLSIQLSPAAVALGIIGLKKEGVHWSSIAGICLGGLLLLFRIFGLSFLSIQWS